MAGLGLKIQSESMKERLLGEVDSAEAVASKRHLGTEDRQRRTRQAGEERRSE